MARPKLRAINRATMSPISIKEPMISFMVVERERPRKLNLPFLVPRTLVKKLVKDCTPLTRYCRVKYRNSKDPASPLTPKTLAPLVATMRAPIKDPPMSPPMKKP